MDDQRLIEIKECLHRLKESTDTLHDDVVQLKGMIVPANIPGGAKGVLERLSAIEFVLNGDKDYWGLIVQHRMMWKSWIWLLCTGSAGIGGAVGAAVAWIVARF